MATTSRATCSGCRPQRTERSRCSTSWAAGASSSCTRSRTSSTWATSTTTARSKADWAEPPDATQHTLGAVALGPIALLTKGLPEYEGRPSGAGAELCLTLLRCVGLISRPGQVLATRPLGAGPQLQTPDGQCLG